MVSASTRRPRCSFETAGGPAYECMHRHCPTCAAHAVYTDPPGAFVLTCGHTGGVAQTALDVCELGVPS